MNHERIAADGAKVAQLAALTEGLRTVRIEKPQDGRAIALPLDGAARIDLGGVAGEKITLVRVGNSLIVLFENDATVTLAPFFDADGAPRSDLWVELGADRGVSGTEFAALFPISTDQTVLPAAGGTPPSSAPFFTLVSVDGLGGGAAALDLLADQGTAPRPGGAQAGGGPFATPPVALDDRNDADPVIEAGVRGGNAPFSGDDTAGGNVLANDVDVDLGDALRVVGVAVGAGATTVGQVGTQVAGTYGTIVIAADGRWTYTLDNQAAATDALAEGETAVEQFRYTAQDLAGNVSTAVLTITVVGSNDRPVILSADTAGDLVERTDGSADENAGALTASGTVAFADVDLSNSHGVTATLVAADGSALGPTVPRGVLTPVLTDIVTGDGHGTVAWTYTVEAGTLDDLAEGETITEVYRVTVTDSSGASAESTVTITLTGRNDRPVIEAASTLDGAITEQAGIRDGVTLHETGGTIVFSDSDLTDQHSVPRPAFMGGVWHKSDGTTEARVVAGQLTIDPVDQGSNTAAWTYRAADRTFDFLAEGETVTITYAVTVRDDSGAADATSTTQYITITATGTNDRPQLSGSLGPTEIDEQTDTTGAETAMTADGTLALFELDLTDTHTVDTELRTIIWPGGDVPTASRAAFLTAMSAAVTDAATGDRDGTVTWSFTVPDKAADFLGEGELLVLSYAVTVTDSSGTATASDTRTVTIVINGTNDRPQIEAVHDAVLAEQADTTGDHATVLTGEGSIDFHDVDTRGTHTLRDATFVSAVWTHGDGTTEALGSDLGALTLGSVNQATDTAAWSYSVADGNLDFLAEGETVTVSYDVTLADNSGASNDAVTTRVTVTITGKNDIAVISAPQADGGSESFEPGWNGATLGYVTPDTGTATDGGQSLMIVGGDGADFGAEDSPGDIEQLLGLETGALAGLDPDVSGGSATAIELELVAGTYTLTFDWKYTAGDAVMPGFVDFAFFSVGDDVYKITDIEQVGDFGETGWATYSFTFTTGGNTTIGFGAMNAGDDQFDSTLWIDNVRVTGASNTDAGSVAEDATLTTTGRLQVIDADHGQSFAKVASGTSIGGYGTYTVAADGTWTYALNNAHPGVQGLKAGETLSDTFTFLSQDGSASRTIAITIHGKDDAPVITGTDRGTVTEDTAITATGQITVTDPDGGQAGIQAVTTARAATYGTWTVTADGLWTYTLNNDLPAVQELVPGRTLSDSFTILTLDGTPKAITVTIGGTNDAPAVTGLTGAVDEDGPVLRIGLTGDDVDVDDSLTTLRYEIVTGPAAGSAVISGARSLIFTPGTDFQHLGVGDTEQVTLTYRAVDRYGVASEPATITITVTGTNDAPRIIAAPGNDRGAVTEDVTATASGQLTAIDPDDGAVFTWSVANNGAGTYGTLTVDQAGQWTYQLDPAAADRLNATDHPVETFTVQVRDQHGALSEQTVRVAVTGSNDAPVAEGENYRVNKDGTLTIAGPGLLANDSDVDSATLQVQLVGNAAHGTLVLNPDGSFTYTPAAGYTGADSFSYQVTDGSAVSDVVTVAIHVNDPPRLDLDADDSAAPGTAYVASYMEGGAAVAIVDGDVRITDSDDQAVERVTITLTNGQPGDQLVIDGPLPAGITATFDAGALILSGSGNPAAYETALKQITFSNSQGTTGYDDRAVTILVNDGDGDSNVATATIHVTPFDDPPAVTRLLENDNVRENQGFQVVATFTVNDVDTAAGLDFAVKDNTFPWYRVRAASGTTYGEPGTYEIYTEGHFVYDQQNADGDPTITRVLQVTDGTTTIEVPFTFTVTETTALPQTQTDLVVTNAGAGGLIEIPDEVLLRNDTDVDSSLSIRDASGDVFGGSVIFSLPASFPGAAYFANYSAFDGSSSVPAAVIVNGAQGAVINGTVNKDILVADVPSQSVGNLAVSPYGNPFTFGEGHLVNEYVGQTFVAAGGMAHNVQFALDHVSGGDVTFRLLIAEVDSAGDPDPTHVIFTSDVLVLAAGSGPTDYDVLLGGLQLEAGKSYALILDAWSPDGTQGVANVVSNENGYADGVFLSLNPDGGAQAEHFNADWSTSSAWDMTFRITSTTTAPAGSTLNGGRWDDSLIGDIGNDILNGDEENDWLFGRDGDDQLNGGTGIDRLIGGRGSDQLRGGADADTFELGAPGDGLDHILDFSSAEGDKVVLDAAGFGFAASTDLATIFGSSDDATFGAGEHLHFDRSTGTLWYDADGAGSASAAIALARLENGADLTAADLRLS